ncbi:MAG TPA: patatin-like phospholipase family protein [Paludibacter sp.]|nr:patatin-like phospholipase family protein [Paludibacter sp.]
MKVIKNLFWFSSRNQSLGICLSGGGALGFAHVGVLQSLEEHGIYPTHIVGSSMGSIIGALYAAGHSPADMLQMIKDDKLYKVTKLMTFKPTFLKSGLSTHNILRTFIKDVIPHNSFEQLKKKLYVCVVNLNKAEWEIIESGNELDQWVAASSSIPGLFETIKVGGNHYVDGGLLNNFPAQGIEEFCRDIIGVDVIPYKMPAELKRPTDALSCAARAIEHQNSLQGRDLCRFIIEPNGIDNFHEFSYESYLAIYQHGYDAANRFIKENPEILKLRK